MTSYSSCRKCYTRCYTPRCGIARRIGSASYSITQYRTIVQHNAHCHALPHTTHEHATHSATQCTSASISYTCMRIVSYRITYRTHLIITNARHHIITNTRLPLLPSQHRAAAHQHASPVRGTPAERTAQSLSNPRNFHCIARRRRTVSIRIVGIGGPGENQTISLFFPGVRK